MKKEELFEIIEDIDSESVKEALEYHGRKKIDLRNLGTIAACFVVIVAMLFIIPTLKSENEVLMIVKAAYPEAVTTNLSLSEYVDSKEDIEWRRTHNKDVVESQKLQPGMKDYYMAIMEQMLVAEDENTVCSPLNAYITLAILSEMSGGNTRQQIMDVLGEDNIESLRNNASIIWKSNYADTPAVKSLLANSLWLDEEINYNDEIVDLLAENYYASTFSGPRNSPERDKALQEWVNENTGGLLTDYAKNLSVDCALEIISTVYHKSMWVDSFYEDNTTKEPFYGTLGNTSVDMMKGMSRKAVYSTDEFTAIALDLYESGKMYFYLPNEEVDVNNLVTNKDIMNVLEYNRNDENWLDAMVNMSIPKFNVSSDIDMVETFQKLGITDAIDSEFSDFSALTPDKKNVYIDEAEQATYVEIDEEGVTGAAYTDIMMDCTVSLEQETIDFTLNRPFMFFITGEDGSILFSGIVRNLPEN